MPDDKVLSCDCGYEVTATDEAELVEGIRRHARDAHGIAFSVEEALLVLLRSELEPSRVSTESDVRGSRARKGGSSRRSDTATS